MITPCDVTRIFRLWPVTSWRILCERGSYPEWVTTLYGMLFGCRKWRYPLRPMLCEVLFAGVARSYRGVQLASFSWERAMPVKGTALGCGFCSRAWPAPIGRYSACC